MIHLKEVDVTRKLGDVFLLWEESLWSWQRVWAFGSDEGLRWAYFYEYVKSLCVVTWVVYAWFSSWWTYMLCPHFSSVLCITLWSSTLFSLALHTKSPASMIYRDGSHVCGVAVDSPYSAQNSLPSFCLGRFQNLNFQLHPTALHWVIFVSRFMTLLRRCSSSWLEELDGAVNLKKLMSTQPVKKLPSFHGTQNTITLFWRALVPVLTYIFSIIFQSCACLLGVTGIKFISDSWFRYLVCFNKINTDILTDILVLAFASTVILTSESRGTHDHILMSALWAFELL
jgi:hypothetical protein